MQLHLLCPPKFMENVMKLHFYSHTYTLAGIHRYFPWCCLGGWGELQQTADSAATVALNCAQFHI